MTTCNVCAKSPATIYFKGVVNHETIKLHLCEPCARKKGMLSPFGKHGYVLEDFATQLAGMVKQSVVKTCAACGLRLTEFQQTGMLGCAQCYHHFADIVGPLLRKIHGSNQHVGKSYRKTVRPLPPTQELSKLKLELRESIAKENFELAATVRDQIRALEREMVKQPETRRDQ